MSISTKTPSTPTLINTIDISEFGAGANSVAVNDGVVAVAVENENTQKPGAVVFFDTDGEVLNSVEVRALPDMLTFSPDGEKVLVANEGEPSDDYTVDPKGSVSIIDISSGVANLAQDDVTTTGFTTLNNREEELTEAGVRIFGPDATVAQDLEPEYITVSEDSTTAWVSLQENNALAELDIVTGEITDILPSGYKDHSLSGNGLDASNEDGKINIATYDNLLGMYQPDAIASYQVNGASAPQQQFDILFAGSGDRLLAGAGKDILFAGKGGSILTGGDGRDQFWIGYNGLL